MAGHARLPEVKTALGGVELLAGHLNVDSLGGKLPGVLKVDGRGGGSTVNAEDERSDCVAG